MTTVVLRSAEGAEARVSLYGGQVTSWKTFGGDDALFLSSKAVFAPGKVGAKARPSALGQCALLSSVFANQAARRRFEAGFRCVSPNSATWAPSPPPMGSRERPCGESRGRRMTA